MAINIYIPARLNSSRLENKALLNSVKGKTLLEHTVDRASKVKDSIVHVVCCDDEVERVASVLDCNVHMTKKDFVSGTARIASVAKGECVVWQVDEPDIEAHDVERLIDNGGGFGKYIGVRTLVAPLLDIDRHNKNAVKAVCSNGRCWWFTRHYIPASWLHVGIYYFGDIKQIDHNLRGDYADLESLEQLSWIERKQAVIESCEIDYVPLSINTPADWSEFNSRLGGDV